MKAVRQGKRYDTTTATNVASWYNTPDTRDFNYVCERLYRTANGGYFLHGEGGAQTKWADVDNPKEIYNGEDIVVLTPQAALEWIEERRVGDVPDGCPELEALVEKG